jgi:competence protein ComEC
MHRVLVFLSCILLYTNVFADAVVVPSERVVTGVKIRASASTSSRVIGKLMPGETATFLGEVPRWNHIDHPTLGDGFVSKSWTRVITDGADTTNKEFDIYVVDIATGLAIFVKGPDFTLVYDAGSNDDNAGNRFLDFLDVVEPGISRIDHVVISHAHADHISMLSDLLDRVDVGQVWDSGVIYASCTYQKLLEDLAVEGAVYHTAIHDDVTQDVVFAKHCSSTGDKITMKFGSRMQTGAVKLGKQASMTFLYVDATPRSDLNENSLVVMLDLADTKILLPGDSGGGGRADPGTKPKEGSVEDALIKCCSDSIVADVLVLGHHGSKTSSRTAFLDAVSATDYIISSGPKPYSGTVLPDAVIVEEVRSRPGAHLFRTDQDDDACRANPNKIGNDNDDRAGGCNTVRIHINPDSSRVISTLSN